MVAYALAALPQPDGSPEVDFFAEFAHLRSPLAAKGLHYLGPVYNADGDRLLLPRRNTGLPDIQVPACLT